MSLERVLQALVSLGLSRNDAKIYVYLATNGPQKPAQIADTLSLSKAQELYPSLESLKDKGIVKTSFEFAAKFDALPFEKALNVLMKAKKRKVQDLNENKEEIVASWRSMIEHDSNVFGKSL